MKRLFIYALVFVLYISNAFAQQLNDNHSAIKLYNNLSYIQEANSSLPGKLTDRLYRKTTQLINQSGIAEIGYSTFFLAPKLDVITVSEDNTGIAKVYLAECELYLSINRVSLNENSTGGATFSSFTKEINGSGLNKDDAIANALNKISGSDKDIVAFLNDSKAKIDNYFKTNCDDVMKQGERALAINDYSQAIALFFSVPSSAPCYENALKRSEAVYTKYVEDDCNKKLIKLKAFVALAPSNDAYYDSVVNIMENINPVSATCYAEAEQIFAKIETRLTDEKKQEWELRKQALQEEGDIQKEMYKAMAEINRDYQPSSTNIIIAH